MSKKLLAALAGAESDDDAAEALSAALEASYMSHPRDGEAAGIALLERKSAERERARREAEEATAKQAAEEAERERIAKANAAAERGGK